jgi:prophage regulatory protein
MADTNDRILRIRAVLDRTGLSRSTLDRGPEPTFPRQVHIKAGFRESAINAWMRNPMFFSVDDARRLPNIS